MARHFLGLYLLIVITLAAVSWGQDHLLQVYDAEDGADERTLAVLLEAIGAPLRALPVEQRRRVIGDIAAQGGADLELFAIRDITGRETLRRLRQGNIAYLQASGVSWVLKQLDADTVLAFKSVEPAAAQRSPLEWALTVLFYAAIALVIMLWIWPLRRDLRALEGAASSFGNKNWTYDAAVKPRSQIYPLAQTFRKMAARIDALIASHKDMSNAVSHEIKTPLARMQFEIELAQSAQNADEVRDALAHIKTDIQAINDLVTATMNYAILERADMALNLGVHDFAVLLPAITEQVRRDVGQDLDMRAEIEGDAEHVVCDMHLLDTVLKNLLYNAARFARTRVRVTFAATPGMNRLWVDDDGPGIPEQDRQRVFDSFVQLHHARGGTRKTGFGLGLAIVKRAIEWHHGEVGISPSPLGGARVAASWPALAPDAATDQAR